MYPENDQVRLWTKKIIPFSSYKIDDLTPVEKHSNELILVLTMSHDLNEAVVESEKGR